MTLYEIRTDTLRGGKMAEVIGYVPAPWGPHP